MHLRYMQNVLVSYQSGTVLDIRDHADVQMLEFFLSRSCQITYFNHIAQEYEQSGTVLLYKC